MADVSESEDSTFLKVYYQNVGRENVMLAQESEIAKIFRLSSVQLKSLSLNTVLPPLHL